ncbi:replication-associated recombination protein A [Arthrobacter castelli]|uniref:replication-associated recombination protein A n=1 Tax=Arthrobacter castelli TaxID=271431 RepID=UPI00041B6DEB|nr:replication-associated recombination protein A [Arthrobacter castelli]
MTTHQPLAARMRPTTLDELVGQDDLIFDGSPLKGIVEGSSQASVLLWGPPGTGKSSIAGIIGRSTDKRFIELSATAASVKEVREVFAAARTARDEDGTSTILFLDEIHRFTKSQQDILLPAVEDGSIALIGATTENPSFSVISALQSRSILLVLKPLETGTISALLCRAIDDPRGLDGSVTAQEHVLDEIAALASGDSRQALGRLEVCAQVVHAAGDTEITPGTVARVTGSATQRYDRDGNQHYDVISAFIKSMRGSDPDAALHWLARMIEAGEDPRFIARRLMVHASEDVGMADPSVLPIAVATAQAVALIGMPEARINLAHATVAIATAPKSRSIVTGIDQAVADVQAGRTGGVPMHLRDAHYPGAKALGHGADYLMPADYPHSVVAQQYLPDGTGSQYYTPTTNGFEQTVTNRLSSIEQITKGMS